VSQNHSLHGFALNTLRSPSVRRVLVGRAEAIDDVAAPPPQREAGKIAPDFGAAQPSNLPRRLSCVRIAMCLSDGRKPGIASGCGSDTPDAGSGPSPYVLSHAAILQPSGKVRASPLHLRGAPKLGFA